jgi:hypothetical protein
MFLFTEASTQTFWLPTKDFPGGPKTGLVITGDSCMLAGLETGIIRSCNNGDNFTQVLKASAIYCIFRTRTGTLLAGGTGKVFLSGDSGQTWDSVLINSGYPVVQIAENQPGGLFCITGIYDTLYKGDGVFYSENGGTVWIQRNNGLGGFNCGERITNDRNGRLYLAMADNFTSGAGGLFISDNNGINWEHIDIIIDGKNTIDNNLQIANTYGLTVSPDDSVYLSFTGSAVNALVTVNIVKNIHDIRSSGVWKTYKVGNTAIWWTDRLLNNIYFARNGNQYSSANGNVKNGGTYFRKNYADIWTRVVSGLSLTKNGLYELQFFAERSNGKIFMVQYLDEHIYQTDTSIVTEVQKIPGYTGKIHIYPNPVARSGKFSVNLKDQLYDGFLSVYDYEGKKVISDTPFLNNLEMTAPALPGLYLLVVHEKYSRKTASLLVK